MDLPAGMTWLDSQVAGHHSNGLKNEIRMIRTVNGCVLKSAQKADLHAREVSFYNKIKESRDPVYEELSTLTPRYYGTIDLKLGGKAVQFIALEDSTVGMIEPCVMDIKVGKRTWDPMASAAKKAAEDSKYAESKKAYGLCIPGFQVYDICRGDLRKFGKDYGKQLNKETFVDALKTFLNSASPSVVPEPLLTALLASLRKIEDFFKRQKSLRFYSSSILVAYDAHSVRAPSAGTASLRARMIDFTHVYEAEEESIDTNYLEGVSNLIKLLSSL